MLTTESGNDGKRPPPSYRDKGWMWSRVGAWCLSWWHDEWSGLHEANRSPPHQDKHQAPSSTLLHPLSLQDAGRTFPHSVGKVHQEAGDASVPIITSFDRQKLSGRGGRLRPSHSRIWLSKFISYQEDWFGLAMSCWHRQEQNAASLHPTNPRQDLSPGESLAAEGCAEYSRERELSVF